MKKDRRELAWIVVRSLLGALVVSYGLLFMWRLGRSMGDADENVTMKAFLLGAGEVNLMKWMLVAGLCFLGILVLRKYGKQIGDYVYRYRYLLALGILVLLVFFEISGSSMACWAGNLFSDKTAQEKGTLFGMARNIRMDE